ncbi:hypothetical protein RB620_00470 [Paenibacillus sp. LHD-117]|uniref:hypothetical protein n=1 Tax=Paenibacillus sp. LHD-117 TaxID=3071412 RepID=UPI0027E1F6BB|nr:hypothetical protein [Paenibacillus sp. LHD-117]MDQ6417897.1 hypothetical protein [Paenibacillus sp. LHD-117]
MEEIYVAPELLELFESVKHISDTWRQDLAVASIISKIFEDNQVTVPIVVGGLVVATYTQGLYKTRDIDLIAVNTDFPYRVMEQLGYVRVDSKDCFNPDMNSIVEFPSGKYSGSYERVLEYEVEETGFVIHVQGMEDIILDRIESYSATFDQRSLEWATKMMGAMYDHLDWSYCHSQASQRNIIKEFDDVQHSVKRYKDNYEKMMDKVNEQLKARRKK